MIAASAIPQYAAGIGQRCGSLLPPTDVNTVKLPDNLSGQLIQALEMQNLVLCLMKTPGDQTAATPRGFHKLCQPRKPSNSEQNSQETLH